jgi:hypothetical protein
MLKEKPLTQKVANNKAVVTILFLFIFSPLFYNLIILN